MSLQTHQCMQKATNGYQFYETYTFTMNKQR